MTFTRHSFLFGILAAVLSVCLVLSGCGSITNDLEIAITQLDALATSLAAAGVLAPAVSDAVNKFGSQAATFLAFVTTETASNDSALIKGQKILAEGTAVLKPDIPPGTPTAILVAVNLVYATIETIIQEIAAPANPTPAQASEFAAKAKKANLSIKAKDKAKLAVLHEKARALAARFQKK